MKLLVVFPLVLAAAAAIPLLGKEQCVHGPEIWCQNVHTASQCGAVKHCQQNVWNKPTVKNMPCDLCKEAVSVVDSFLKDNNTETEILTFLEKICDLAPSPLSSECKELVDEYIPTVFNIIKEELDNPSVACCAIGLCRSLQRSLGEEKQLETNEIPGMDLGKITSPFIANLPLLMFPQEKSQKGDGDVCKDCVQLISDVVIAIKSNSSFVSNYLEFLKKQCDDFGGPMAEECKNWISQYSDVAIQMLIQMKPSAVCCMAGLCQETKSVPLLSLVPAKVVPAKVIPALKLVKAIKKENHPEQTSVQCEICQIVVGKIVDMLENNKTEENIEQALDKVCSLLPQKYSDQCKDLVDTYTPALIALLMEEANPKSICCSLGLCNNRLKMQYEMISPKDLQSGPYCETCKMVVMYLDKLLEKNATQGQIENALEIVCNYLPPAMQKQCDQYVQQYSSQLLQFLLIMLDPSFVCLKVGACESSAHLLGTKECTYGPSYWCKNMETATTCNAVEHCKRHVWN
ncbi:prosaposin [Lissotriton helveticus]